MEDLIKAIRTTPIIDNHAHPLFVPAAYARHPLLAITTPAEGRDALKATPSSLSHIRAVRQLSKVLGCPQTWPDVVRAIEAEREKPDDAWTRRCLEGIETILIDDGLDAKDDVYDYTWHSRLTNEKCKRIVRIETVAEEIIKECIQLGMRQGSADGMFEKFFSQFTNAIAESIDDPEVVAFKSVICYRTGLDIASIQTPMPEIEMRLPKILSRHKGGLHFSRLEDRTLNSFLLHITAAAIQNAESTFKKPLQFHTGLGDQDITMTLSSPSHLQEFIREYPQVPIVLLHGSYPWTKEAGYLATVYDNVFTDIGEIFPLLSRDGQETVIREILELCPSEKIVWSTDGHGFPEKYLLAVIQIREALEAVLSEYVRKEDLTVHQAVKVVQDILFNTSNTLYNLNLPLKASSTIPQPLQPSDVNLLTSFLDEHPSTEFLRLTYSDYTATPRVRILPAKRALALVQEHGYLTVGITAACLGLLQNDSLVAGVTATGEYRLLAILSSIRPGPSESHASVQCEFLHEDNSEVDICPRSVLRRSLQTAKARELEFLLGFEVELVFMSRTQDGRYTADPASAGHAWNSARVLQGKTFLPVLDEIYDNLSKAGIYVEVIHPESGTGQYEIVLTALPPLEAVDTLLQAREIIFTVAASHSLRATLFPKPFPTKPGTASHAHISISSPAGKQSEVYESFYAGVLQHLRAIIAFTYSNPASYARMVDGCWAGGRWVTWGTQNREAPLRKIAGSHWELKVLDGLANVYLAMAAIITVGTEGVVNHEQLTWHDCVYDPAELTPNQRKILGIKGRLPTNLDDALAVLDRDATMRRMLGDGVLERYISVKRAEMELLGGMSDDEQQQWMIERY